MSTHRASPAPPAAADKSAFDRELERSRSESELLRDENEELRESQSQLEESRDAYAELYDLAPLPLLTLTKHGTIRSANRCCAELFQTERAWFLGRLLLGFVHSDDRVRLVPFLAGQTGESSEYCEVRLVLPSQTVVPTQLRRRLSTRLPGVIHLSLLDLRERERDLWEKNLLVEAERRARAALDSKDHFIAMLSHELRTPLTPVLAVASTYGRTEALPPEIREAFAVIARNISAEARLIDDLLDATGIARGKVRVLRQPTDMHALLVECLATGAPQAASAGITLSQKLDADFPVTSGDGLRLRQVFSNLLNNALHHTPRGGEIRVASWNRDGRLVIEVQDSGVGFDPLEAPRLFTAFERLEHETHRHGGLGLGLAICKGLVELHDGTISATSPGAGLGARFLVELPALSVAAPIVEQVDAPSTLPGGPPSDVVLRRRVLLVEDHEDTSAMMKALLEMQGFSVVIAGSIAEALRVDLGSVDVILSDIGLPDGSGTELLERLPERSIPAIALSGYGMASDVQRSKASGFALHLTKPIVFDELLSALDSLLGRGAGFTPSP